MNPRQPRLIQMPKVLDRRGNLSFIQNGDALPFEMRRVYWIYDVPAGEHRAGHAFHRQQQIVVAMSGSFDVIVDNGFCRRTFSLNRSFQGLLLPEMTWRELNNFSTNAVALVISSTSYDEDDYIRDYDEFLQLANDPS